MYESRIEYFVPVRADFRSLKIIFQDWEEVKDLKSVESLQNNFFATILVYAHSSTSSFFLVKKLIKLH